VTLVDAMSSEKRTQRGDRRLAHWNQRRFGERLATIDGIEKDLCSGMACPLVLSQGETYRGGGYENFRGQTAKRADPRPHPSGRVWLRRSAVGFGRFQMRCAGGAVTGS
jgi:hypothetical protein